MAITTTFASLLALWLVLLSLRVIGLRRAGGASADDAQREILRRAIRAQGNLTEYAPIFLILLGLAEFQGQHELYLWLTGGAFLLGRLLHGAVFAFLKPNMLLRVGGTLLTLTPLLILAVGNLLL